MQSYIDTERDRDLPSGGSLSHDNNSQRWPGPGQSWEPGNLSKSPMWLVEAQVRAGMLLSPSALHWKWNKWDLNQEMGC